MCSNWIPQDVAKEPSLALGERLVMRGPGWLRIWGPAWEAGPGLLGFKGLPLLPSAEAASLLGAGTCPRV